MTTTEPVASLLSQRPENPVVGEALHHESAALHVTGQALYTDDLVGRTTGVLHAHPVQAPHAHALVTSLDVAPAYDVPGVVRVLTAADVPGVNDAGVKHDEPLFPSEVMYYGHAVCWVLGETLEAARRGAAAVAVDYDDLPALIRVEDAIKAGSFQGAGPTMARGDSAGGLARASHVFEGVTTISGQEHFYLETHCSLALFDESGQVFVQSSTQHPTERDSGDRCPRSRRCQPCGDRAMPSDGWRVRRQGNAAARSRGRCGAGCDPHRATGAGAAHPCTGHVHDGQAPRIPCDVDGRLR